MFREKSMGEEIIIPERGPESETRRPIEWNIESTRIGAGTEGDYMGVTTKSSI